MTSRNFSLIFHFVHRWMWLQNENFQFVSFRFVVFQLNGESARRIFHFVFGIFCHNLLCCCSFRDFTRQLFSSHINWKAPHLLERSLSQRWSILHSSNKRRRNFRFHFPQKYLAPSRTRKTAISSTWEEICVIWMLALEGSRDFPCYTHTDAALIMDFFRCRHGKLSRKFSRMLSESEAFPFTEKIVGFPDTHK